MTESKTTSLDLKTLGTIASHPHRRFLLRELEPAEPVPIDDLVRGIADRDPEHSSPLDRSARREIEIGLVHDHLPRLDAHDVLEYDRRSNEVVLTADVDVERPLESALAELAG